MNTLIRHQVRYKRRNFENRPVFDEVMCVDYIGLLFLAHPVCVVTHGPMGDCKRRPVPVGRAPIQS